MSTDLILEMIERHAAQLARIEARLAALEAIAPRPPATPRPRKPSGRLTPEAAATRARILAQLRVTRDPCDTLQIADIAAHLAANGVHLPGPTRSQQMAIADALREVGVTRIRSRVFHAHDDQRMRRIWVGVKLRQP